MSHNAHPIDLAYRPRTYFWPHGLKPHPLSSIKGANRIDLFLGPGPEAAAIAGAQSSPARLILLIPATAAARLKP